MRKSMLFLASVVATVFMASSASAATSYETEVTWGVNFRDQPSTSGYKYRMIPKGEDIHVIQKSGSWLKIQVQDGTIGYISAGDKYTDYKGTASTSIASSTRDKLVSTARSYIGDFKYKWGAEPWNTNYNYADCSSYTELVYRKLGIDIPRTSRSQALDGTYVSKSNLKKGDLVFFDTTGNGTINHVGMYIGNGEFIHASPIFDGVGISNLNSNYWSDHYVKARSIL
jgi:cell wall-associated NlpC family hydrolase